MAKDNPQDCAPSCKAHSGIVADIEHLKNSDTEQWDAINKLRNRPPVWTTVIISLLSFLLGCSITYASLR